MKLNPTQIERLFAFTQSHYVEYYDVQLELVDHLANAIEEAMMANPALDFEQALQAEFKKFGIFGFMDVVGSRQAAMYRQYRKMVWKDFFEFFKVPKIALSLLGVVAMFCLLKIILWRAEAMAGMLGVLTLFLYGRMMMEAIKRNNKNRKEKRWLFEEVVVSHGSIASFTILPVQLVVRLADSSWSWTADWVLWVASFFIVSYGIVCYVMLYALPPKAKAYLSKTYPEYTAAAV